MQLQHSLHSACHKLRKKYLKSFFSCCNAALSSAHMENNRFGLPYHVGLVNRHVHTCNLLRTLIY